MSQKIAPYVCEDCGDTVVRRFRSDRARVCLECGIERVRQNAYRRAMAASSRRAVIARQATSSTRR